ncbi:MAG: hypothetical protein QOE70_1875 [Chthoniobacter sp.]|nr:hypothetical protein [Chthoniobacter sp.]
MECDNLPHWLCLNEFRSIGKIRFEQDIANNTDSRCRVGKFDINHRAAGSSTSSRYFTTFSLSETRLQDVFDIFMALVGRNRL